MADYSSRQVKWHLTLKNEGLQGVFKKKILSLKKFDASNIWCLTVVAPKTCSTPKEN